MSNIKHTLNSRSYKIFFNIAENALKAIQKAQEYTSETPKNIDCDYIFDELQLRIICFDYLFSSLENFLEHIGYILFSDWDSKKSQRHYAQKQTKLLQIKDAIVIKEQLQLDFLQEKWHSIIESIDFKQYTNIRNPIKHIHAEKHDAKTQSGTRSRMTHDEFEQINRGTLFALTTVDCEEFIKQVETLINSVHTYLKENKLFLRIYSEHSPNQSEQLEQRKTLLRTFLGGSFAPPLYTTTSQLN